MHIGNLLPSNQRPYFLRYLNLPPIVVVLHARPLVAVHYTVVEALLAIPTVYRQLVHNQAYMHTTVQYTVSMLSSW